MKKLILCSIVLFYSLTVYGQIEKPVKWSYAAKKINSTEAILYLKATIDEGWHIYSQKKTDNGGPTSTSFSFTPSSGYTLVNNTIEPKPVTRFEPTFNTNVSFFERSVVFQQKIKLKTTKTTVKGIVNFMVCNDEKCLPPDELNFSIPIK
jgi:DsbC/DsbD-like thiol-disulfide interchange protein